MTKEKAPKRKMKKRLSAYQLAKKSRIDSRASPRSQVWDPYMGFLDPLPPHLMPKWKGKKEKADKNEQKCAGQKGISTTQRLMGEAGSQKRIEKLEDLMEKGKE